MSIEKNINKYTDNNIILPSTESYSVILGINPSQGARSPKLWNSAYSNFNISSQMIPVDVSEDNFLDLMGILENDSNFSGGAIAAPHKETAAEYIGQNLTKEAKSIGAINCLFRDEHGKLCGTNTDGEGSLKAFEEEFGKIDDNIILILGIGGTGKAVSAYFSSAANDINQIYVSSRSDSALKLADEIRCNYVKWSSISEFLPKVDILINCTSLGSTIQPGLSPIIDNDFNKIKKDAIVYDVIYDPNPTPFLKQANLHGKRTLNGSLMNFEQAVIGFHYAASNAKQDLNVIDIRQAMK